MKCQILMLSLLVSFFAIPAQAAGVLVPISDLQVNLETGCGAQPRPDQPPPVCPTVLVVQFKVESFGPCHSFQASLNKKGSLQILDTLVPGCKKPDTGPSPVSVSLVVPKGKVGKSIAVLNPTLVNVLPRP